MRQLRRFATEHEDLIHDVAYDFYGKRLATCSSDQQIKIWDLDENNTWQKTAEWKAHTGSVWKIAWAHPEFGQVIASCSFDHTVCIWEEGEVDDNGHRKWHKRQTLGDSRGSVSDIKFAPRHLGFKLATCSADGFVRIYEAVDTMNLSHWSPVEEFEVHSKQGNNCISWNPSPFGAPTIVVGSEDPNAKIWEYSEAHRKWEQVVTLKGHVGAIHDVAWAPNLGRSYHLIATASKDKTVRIWKFVNKVEFTELACFKDHNAEVWRVEWNITGTVLASSGDDCAVRLWKASPQSLQDWRLLDTLYGPDDTDPTRSED